MLLPTGLTTGVSGGIGSSERGSFLTSTSSVPSFLPSTSSGRSVGSPCRSLRDSVRPIPLPSLSLSLSLSYTHPLRSVHPPSFLRDGAAVAGVRHFRVQRRSARPVSLLLALLRPPSSVGWTSLPSLRPLRPPSLLSWRDSRSASDESVHFPSFARSSLSRGL